MLILLWLATPLPSGWESRERYLMEEEEWFRDEEEAITLISLIRIDEL